MSVTKETPQPLPHFNLKQWDDRTPIDQDITKPWGEYHVFRDFAVTSENPLPNKILAAIHERFQALIQDLTQNSNVALDPLIRELADESTTLVGLASADEKILAVEPKQPGYEILSMQYHGKPGFPGHIEVWEFVTPGSVVLGTNAYKPFGWTDAELEVEMKALQVIHFKPGQKLVILPGQWHALAKPKELDYTVVREWRITPQPGRSSQERENNIVRTYDNSGRGTLGAFPQEIMDQI